MFEINNLYVSTIDNKEILKGLNLKILDGEVHVIMGPNGAGKSTLVNTIMGNNNYVVNSGDIIYKNKSIIDLETDKRANMGIFMSFQSPYTIDGVLNSEFLRTALSNKINEKVNIFTFMKDMDKAINDLSMDHKMLHRSINKDFSGGERKKNEILQMKILKPDFIILDELDSGLDVDSLKIVCDNINDYLKEYPNTKILMITHYTRMLEYIKPDYVHMLVDGKIEKTGNIDFAYKIDSNGYMKKDIK